MPKEKPEFSSKTRLDNDTATDVNVSMRRSVTYVFHIISAKNLNIPYAFAINGKVGDEFSLKPKQVSSAVGKIIVRNIDPGSQVCLYLNSDAHPNYRNKPVYIVTPHDRDVIVKIEEKKGRHLDTDVPVRISDAGTSNVDNYQASLTGDIWMKVSHKYTSEEATSFLSQVSIKEIKEAVKKIYDGLNCEAMEIGFMGLGSNKNTLLIIFEDSENARENISHGYDFLKEGLTRVHPGGYAAIFAAAIETGINKLVMTSAWRPMLGSIAHRAGLGVDINYINSIKVNREKLRKKSATETGSVSQEEKSLFADLEVAKGKKLAAQQALLEAEIELKNVRSEPEKIILSKQKLKDAIQKEEMAEKNRKDLEVAWNAERDKNEPEVVRNFRAALMRSKSVSQLFDPWFMDSNNRDSIPAVPNMQATDNEKLHAHHLHITVHEPKIL